VSNTADLMTANTHASETVSEFQTTLSAASAQESQQDALIAEANSAASAV
jgi:hypothetical protein